MKRKQLIAALKADYQRRIETVAVELAPAFEYAKRIAAVVRTDPLRADDLCEPSRRLESECKRAFCPTENEALLCWALSSHRNLEPEISLYDDLRVGCSIAIAGDVATAGGMRWYAENNGEAAR